MKVTITFIHLKSPFSFFSLSYNALQILKQLQTTNCADFKKRGIWTKHYTMTLWNSQEELRSFATNDAHAEAMKKAPNIAKEIVTYTYDATQLPTWKEALELLKNGKSYKY